jgi:hypothetical protein
MEDMLLYIIETSPHAIVDVIIRESRSLSTRRGSISIPLDRGGETRLHDSVPIVDYV